MSLYPPFIRALNLYAGLPIFICGTFGNLINIRCFWTTRRNSCGFIFLALSVTNCVVLFYGLFIRILTAGFDVDWTIRSVVWCKTRMAFSETPTLISLSLMCFASIDRLFLSCRQPKFRQLSQLPLARWFVSLTVIFWICHAIPNLIYSNIISHPITGLMVCFVSRPAAYTFYQMYIAVPLYLTILPTTILITTGLITYINTQKLQANRQRHSLQRNLTLMMLMQIPILVLTTLPLGIYIEYALASLLTEKSSEQQYVENVVANIVTLLYYITFSCQFYLFLLHSAGFRQDMKKMLRCRAENCTRNGHVEAIVMTVQRSSVPTCTRESNPSNNIAVV